MKPRLLLFTAACMLFAACGNSRGDLSTGIIPAPQQVAWGDGAFRMPSTLLFATNLEGQAKADLEAWMRRSGDGFFPVSFAEAAGDDIPVLYLLLAEGGAPESYRLDVARGKITVTAPDAAGLFYGLQSLGQLAERYEETFDDPDFYLEGELVQRLTEALRKMPPEFRQTFRMHRLEGMTHKEIAVRLNVSPQTVNYRIGQTVRLLREELSDYWPLLVLLLWPDLS